MKPIKIIIDFGYGKKRKYSLIDSSAEALRTGEYMLITICHPDYGEIFIAQPTKKI
jgi:hypothetical protein